MRTFLQIWVVLLAGVLVYTGCGIAVSTFALPAPASLGHLENNAGWLPTSFPVSSGLDRTGESIGTANAPVATNHKDDHSSGSLSTVRERHLQNRISGYLALSRAFQIGLPISRILFPAHFFG
ncbi:MAG: hypothetical protein H6563_05875 [Lewinellaceae bacterium]|nr:hypothetical protein [Lewinellaceae bacterium]